MFPLVFARNVWSLFFVVLTLPPWIASFVFSFHYIKKNKVFFFTFFTLTFLANIMIFFAGNFLTILIFFEMISMMSIPLVFFEKTKESIKAGKIYFYFCLLSGILVFAGTMILSVSPSSPLAFALMACGFLIKCGAYPFHVWLPQAHPVAPSPASAILSGCIIKVGFYGLFRVVLTWNPSEEIGLILLGISLITMLYGVFQALFQTNAKKMLAYHSVSQMGYILLGLAMYIITMQSVPLTGSLMHAMNHAFFKSALFLAIGILYLDSHTYDMYKMKGYWKKAPIISLLFLVAILGISGTPFFNGFVSKTFIHEELLIEKAFLFKLSESIFLLTAIGTFVSNFKMYYLINLRHEVSKFYCKKRFQEIFPLSILALLILGFGIFPMLETFILPMKLLPHTSELLEEIIPFHKIFIENLPGFLWIMFAGISLIYVGLKWEWFHKKIPPIVDPLFWYQKFFEFMVSRLLPFLLELEVRIIYFYSWFVKSSNHLLMLDNWVEKTLYHQYQAVYKSQIKFFVQQNSWEKRINLAISYVILPDKLSFSDVVSHKFGRVDQKIQKIYPEMLQLIRFLFSVSDRQESKSSKYYEDFLEKKGKNIVIALAVVIVLLTVSFLFLYWCFAK
jgi:hydrogenase-4 component B